MTPGELFIALWERVEPHASEVVALPWRGRSTVEFRNLVDSLVSCDTEEVPGVVNDYLDSRPVKFAFDTTDSDQRAFVVMCALDEAAGYIHPSVKTRMAGLHATIGDMLVSMREAGTGEGMYAETPFGYVILKGKLRRTRADTDALEASGTEIAHQFSYLTVARPLNRGRSLKFISLPPSRFQCAPEAADKVGFAPIAEDPNDLDFITTSRGGRAYLDTKAVDGSLSLRANETVASLIGDGAGIVILPELVSDRNFVSSLANTLRAGQGETDVLILSGTGPGAVCPKVDRPHNEAVIMDGKGEVLFRQRKLNLFNMAASRMRDCNIPSATGCDGESHMEDAAPGSELVVCDLFGLGRVVVLICEDLQQLKPGGEVCENVRPDWILTPVLDVAPQFGRWVHTRAVEIGTKTGSRFVVSCSGTLSVRLAKKDALAVVSATAAHIGMCVDAEAGFKTHFVSPEGLTSPVRSLINWKPATWDHHYTGAASELMPKPAVKSKKPSKRVTKKK